MEFKITEINTIKCLKTRFYSVRFQGKEKSEFKDFYERMKLDSVDFKEFSEIVKWFMNWANHEGALYQFFREERDADRLLQPEELTIHDGNESETNQGLRWYCYRRSNEVVILFNGGRKTNQDPTKCKNVKKYFREAIDCSKAIFDYFEDGTLYIENEFELKVKEGATLKI